MKMGRRTSRVQCTSVQRRRNRKRCVRQTEPPRNLQARRSFVAHLLLVTPEEREWGSLLFAIWEPCYRIDPCYLLLPLTFSISCPLWLMKAYTRVLQGHIGLATAKFPDGTPGFMIDAFARRHLWDAGLDYQHGTGHGVGAALNVHEGPHVSLALFFYVFRGCLHLRRGVLFLLASHCA